MTEKAFFDTNILVYAYIIQSDRKAGLSRQVIGQGGWISTQVVSETCKILLTKGGYSEDEIRTVIRECCREFRVCQIDEAVLLRASRIREGHGFSYWDSTILAASIEAGCSVLYSEDLHHGFTIDDVRIINPFL